MTAEVVDAGTGFVAVGSIEDMTPGEGRTYVVGGVQIAVFRLGDGSVRATSAQCPHRGGPIADGQIDLDRVMCPLHQYLFAFADGRCTDPSVRSLPVYPARVVDGIIEVAF
ncbi:Rieske (2Fe-2S) protein [Williamsia sterculiae]|uniref:Nitrite reductase (NADH) small subunit n=1 Tax=Williamsia sterculiae TaxID=1344003 RepID=A0A1N7ELW7_9NOCA|nr:Rieske (2Fe-2S) protein [Williamsia sterculiae]SIR89076.1 nitrite reductase (NADH) small subunit [Williamsia sterculiae]